MFNVISCDTKSISNVALTNYSSELDENGDTCNRIVNGIKHGKWLVIDSNEWRKGKKKIIDTVYYDRIE